MNRRSFIKKAGLATAGVYMAPYILPSGRLFASTGARKANHVVFCLFAGGVRNFESVQKKDGNLMPYSLNGNESISNDIASAMSPLPSVGGNRLQSYGTLFKEFRYKSGPTGHYNGHSVAMTGVYTTTDLNIKDHPEYPTVFEYYRKHSSPSKNPLNSWWISNMLGPYPALNYSKDPGYGALYGANFVQPLSLVNYNSQNNNFQGYLELGNPKNFNTSDKATYNKFKNYLDRIFSGNYNPNDAGPINPEMDADKLNVYIQQILNEASIGAYANPWGINGGMSGDMYNVMFAERILKEFKPELLVVNMFDVDIGHSNFTQYANNIRKADYALWHLWDTIQSTPGLANDTILIAAPEHGRNLDPNSIIDNYGRYALDHTSDQTSREIFCMVLGPQGVVKQNQVISSEMGESIDIVPTICDILGFYPDIPAMHRNRMGSPLSLAFE